MQIFINTYGTYLHVKDDMFEIKVRTDKTQPFKINNIAAHKVTSFIISKGASLTTDAIALALKHNIDIVIVENNGHPLGRFWHSKLGSTTKIRKRQLETSLNADGLEWVKQWLCTKLQNQSDYLADLRKHRPNFALTLKKSEERILEQRSKIAELKAGAVSEVADRIRGLEGTAGRLYFDGLSKCIPEEFAFSGRSFRPAENPFNAMLNYAYGILYSRTERALMFAGIDPYVGFLHRDDYNSKSLVYDFIESYRICAERCVFGLFSKKQVNKSFFSNITGGISLNAEGKPVLVEHFTRYMEQDTIRHNGRNQTRYNAMQLDAHNFANSLIAKEV